jgi:hypothetical protein
MGRRFFVICSVSRVSKKVYIAACRHVSEGKGGRVVRSGNLVYILVVIILVIVALLLLSRLL